jgi:hypothetical protein
MLSIYVDCFVVALIAMTEGRYSLQCQEGIVALLYTARLLPVIASASEAIHM